MTEATTLFGIAQESAVHAFVFDFMRYLIAASLISAIVWLLMRTPWRFRKIQERTATGEDFRREFFASVRTVLVYVVVSIGIIWAVRHGFITVYEGSASLGVQAAYFAAILLAHDAYFYWSHRAMHHPRLFKTFHRFHHKTTTPTAWAAYSFAIPEAVVMGLFMPLWLWLVPTPHGATFTFLAVMILRNAMGHAGLELHAKGWASHPVLKWISTTTHHDLHHAGSFRHNYGFYFTVWDKMMGTEHPDYVAVYDRVTGSVALQTSESAGWFRRVGIRVTDVPSNTSDGKRPTNYSPIAGRMSGPIAASDEYAPFGLDTDTLRNH